MNRPSAFEALPDLASRQLGGGVVYANDEFFAAADNLVTADAPTFTPRTFGPKGQVYDGWETRRRRDAAEGGHDHAIVRLGVPGLVHGVVIDTAFFTGNYPPHASVEACGVSGNPDPAELADAAWVTALPRSPLQGDARNPFPVDLAQRVTHVRLCIYPDGGVARLRVHGEAIPDPRLFPHGVLDLAAAENGALVVGCSDMFYGAPSQLILPDRARVMGEGWETARRRDEANDWVRIALAAPGRIDVAELDTSHFKGNAPGSASLRGIDARVADPQDEPAWFDILPRTRLQPDTQHRFRVPAAPLATQVRLDVFPDGGMTRLRLWGRLAPADHAAATLRWFNLLPPDQASALLAPELDAVAAQRLVAGRPLAEIDALPPALRP
jgi:allantoicase